MNTMLSQLQPDEPAGKLFTALYLQQLPMAIREQVAPSGLLICNSWQSLLTHSGRLTRLLPSPPLSCWCWVYLSGQSLPAAMAALVTLPLGPAPTAILPATGIHWVLPRAAVTGTPPAYICYYHEQFGTVACNWRPPSAWPENSGAGGGN